MMYLSTRDKTARLSAPQAIAQGLSLDGGLFTPERLPQLSKEDIQALMGMNYQQRAAYIMSLFLPEFTKEELTLFSSQAYEKFDAPAVAPLYHLDETTHFLELWHGPTCAFKDMALQMLPYLLTASLEKTGEEKTVCILVATSGDTGKAALEGFCDVARTKILVFYPQDGVSDIQKLQMTTQDGGNVGVCAVHGNFDDAQTGVKRIFSDVNLRERLAGRGYFLSSANSINWGRVLPQIVYYCSAYCDLVNAGAAPNGKAVNFCVPTGNFGNILSGYYAKKMGIPIDKLICASNTNNVLTDFIWTGVYDRNRPFYTTTSPSMDILISSNLERLLFDLSGGDDAIIRGYMSELSETGRYEISKDMKLELSKTFHAGYCQDADAAASILDIYQKHGYLIDTHTAVAVNVLKQYRNDSGDQTPAVIVSTASPFKFCDSVLDALGVDQKMEGTEIIRQLSEVSGVNAPAPLLDLANKTPRFTDVIEKEEMSGKVEEMLV